MEEPYDEAYDSLVETGRRPGHGRVRHHVGRDRGCGDRRHRHLCQPDHRRLHRLGRQVLEPDMATAAVALALAGAAAVCDWAWRRVPNWLTVPALAAGLGLSYYNGR